MAREVGHIWHPSQCARQRARTQSEEHLWAANVTHEPNEKRA